MDVKGQVSAEYLLLLVVLLIVMAGITIPLVSSSINSGMDVSKSSDSKNALQSIANAVNVVYANGPGSKRTINVYMPQNGNISVNNGAGIIYQTLPLSSQNKTLSAEVDYSTTVLNPNPVLNSGWHQTQVTWGPGNSTITVSFLT